MMPPQRSDEIQVYVPTRLYAQITAIAAEEGVEPSEMVAALLTFLGELYPELLVDLPPTEFRRGQGS